jgi:hypothetical protein
MFIYIKELVELLKMRCHASTTGDDSNTKRLINILIAQMIIRMIFKRL